MSADSTGSTRTQEHLRPHILIAAQDPVLRERLGSLLRGHPCEPQVRTASSSTEALEIASALGPDVVLVSADLSAPDAYETIRQILARVPGVSTLLVAERPSPDDFRQALRAGARDLVPPNISAGEFSSVLEAALDVSRGKRSAIEELKKQTDENPTAKMLVVFSTKGGTGKTFLAVNLAAGLASAGRRVALVDLDLQFGDAAIALGLVPQQTIYDLVQTYDQYDAPLLESFMLKHDCGLHLLPAPLYPDQAEKLAPDDVKKILTILSADYEFVVVDTPPILEERVMVALDEADTLLFIGSMDLPTIKNMRVTFNTLSMMSYPPDKLRVVMNRADSKVGLKLEEAERYLGMKIQYSIPSSVSVVRALNSGELIINTQRAGKSPVATELHRIVSSFDEQAVANGHYPRRLFRRSRGED